MEVGEWGGSMSRSELFRGKLSHDCHVLVLIFWASIPCVFCVYIHVHDHWVLFVMI